jgi:hypothetical protein
MTGRAPGKGWLDNSIMSSFDANVNGLIAFEYQ